SLKIRKCSLLRGPDQQIVGACCRTTPSRNHSASWIPSWTRDTGNLPPRKQRKGPVSDEQTRDRSRRWRGDRRGSAPGRCTRGGGRERSNRRRLGGHTVAH